MDGRKNQKAPWASSATRSPSRVSRQTQMKVSRETSGSETMSPPTPGDLRAIFRRGGDDDPGDQRLDREIEHAQPADG